MLSKRSVRICNKNYSTPLVLFQWLLEMKLMYRALVPFVWPHSSNHLSLHSKEFYPRLPPSNLFNITVYHPTLYIIHIIHICYIYRPARLLLECKVTAQAH